MTYDTTKTTDPVEADESCIRDDSTECDCPRCRGAEERFWSEQGGEPESGLRDEDFDRGESDYEDLP